jgi:hypothetical protein
MACPRPVDAQSTVALGAAGLATGAFTGIYTTTAIYVAKARTGRFLFSVDEFLSLRPETLPLIIGPVAGTVVGLHSGRALGGAVTWGGWGFVLGAIVGGATGQLAWPGEEGRWAGAIMGSATGLLVGLTLGARARWDEEDPGGDRGFSAQFSIPVSLLR